MRSLIFGTSDDVEDLILELFKQNLDIDFEHDYYLNIPPPPKEDTTIDYGDSVVSGLFVDLTVELIDAILRWLKEKEKLVNPNLEISIEGNLVNVDVRVMEQLQKVLKRHAK
ncbi:MAG: hypothetical protein P8Y18_02270 [Candidatus Bathyarchaeota archaeon]